MDRVVGGLLARLQQLEVAILQDGRLLHGAQEQKLGQVEGAG